MSIAESRGGQLDDVVHSPVRFSILAALASVDSANYQTLKDTLDVSYALLSKHAAILEESGYISIEKSFLGKKAQTVFRLTDKGEAAFRRHVNALHDIMNGLK